MDRNNDGIVVTCQFLSPCLDNELGHLRRYNAISSENWGLFTNIQPSPYWSNTTDTTKTDWAYAVDYYYDGTMNAYDYGSITKSYNAAYSWAVHDGDIGVAIPSAVPLPASAWLFGSGLLGLIRFARRQ